MVAEETQRFIRQVIFDLNGDYAALLTAPFTIITAADGTTVVGRDATSLEKVRSFKKEAKRAARDATPGS